MAEVADFIFGVSAAVTYPGCLLRFCILPLAALKIVPIPSHLLLKLLFEVGVGSSQEIFLHLQLCNTLLQIFDFLPQFFNLDNQLLELLVVEVVKLMHLQLYNLASQLAIFLEKLLQLGGFGAVR
jgi:hypothetical protein